MASGLLVLVPLALLLPLAVLVLVVLALTARPDAEIGPATAAARRHAVVGGVLAVVAAIGAAAAVGVASRGLDGLVAGQVVAILFLAAAVVHTLVLALTEVTWPRPTGQRRSGVLVRRRVPDVLARPALVVTALLTALAVMTCLVGTLAADATGRSVTRRGDLAGDVVSWSAGPFPGAFYALPVLAGLAVLGCLVAVTLRQVVSRPAVAGADVATDTALRRAGAHRVLRGAGAGVGLTAAGLLGTAGSAVHGVSTGSSALAAIGVVLAVGGVVVGLLSLALLLVPAPRVRAPAPEPVPVPA
jgi:hypothetical protein